MPGLLDLTAPAHDLYDRLLGAALEEGVTRVLPFWADGGDGPDDRLAPAEHVLAAWPSSVVRARLADLGPNGLGPFLRRAATALGPKADPRAEVPLHVVYLAYGAGRAATGNERLFDAGVAAHDDLPDVIVATYDGYLVAPGARGPWRIVGDVSQWERRDMVSLTGDAATPGALVDHDVDHQTWRRAFARIQDGIAAGDYYQVNLARRLVAAFEPRATRDGLALAARALHRAWRATQPTAFATTWPLDEDAWLVSASPECLLDWRGDSRVAASFPIKGTVGRDQTATADEALATALHASLKDRAEHVMIVDLVRHDLGRVARTGTVSVPSLMAELRLKTVRHLVSEVRCELAREHDVAALVDVLFPGGSITGAPKIAAMAEIARSEGFERGPYCGSLGVVRGGSSARFSILIRTALLTRDLLSYGTGGGIVSDSEGESELRETMIKATALRAALEGGFAVDSGRSSEIGAPPRSKTQRP